MLGWRTLPMASTSVWNSLNLCSPPSPSRLTAIVSPSSRTTLYTIPMPLFPSTNADALSSSSRSNLTCWSNGTRSYCSVCSDGVADSSRLKHPQSLPHLDPLEPAAPPFPFSLEETALQ
ncbi:Os01g0514850 [Oryza sativa Japonica Group]|uniref:Os01g0514850 protein n=1 Tax=Oryza sativa subsp. japonica TaxID=39947 RepID=A0A0P0V3A2_ORYSJ|nr:hypothetical protein EE612_003037 [Oryza sativa]BAS72410.1 Os01g0514850 [Oryza sativa Japonica Group]